MTMILLAISVEELNNKAQSGRCICRQYILEYNEYHKRLKMIYIYPKNPTFCLDEYITRLFHHHDTFWSDEPQ
jgi:cytidine deaminase